MASQQEGEEDGPKGGESIGLLFTRKWGERLKIDPHDTWKKEQAISAKVDEDGKIGKDAAKIKEVPVEKGRICIYPIHHVSVCMSVHVYIMISLIHLMACPTGHQFTLWVVIG